MSDSDTTPFELGELGQAARTIYAHQDDHQLLQAIAAQLTIQTKLLYDLAAKLDALPAKPNPEPKP